MSLYLFDDPAEFAGLWYLPTNDGTPVAKIPGTLKWNDRSAMLGLQGTFTPTLGTVYGSADVKAFPTVHGETTASVPVTLLDSLGGGNEIAFGQLGIKEAARLRADICVVGAHVDKETKYSSIQARVPGLEHWLDMAIVTAQWPTSTSTSTTDQPQRVIYTVTNHPGLDLRIDKHAMTLTIGLGFSAPLLATTSVSINGYGCIEIEPDAAQPMEWMLERLGESLSLLSFFSGSPMSTSAINAKLPEHKPTLNWLVRLGDHELCTVKRASDFFMTRGAMETPLSEVLARWYDGYDNIATPSQLGLSVINSKGLWAHVAFLSYMQAFEGLHRADSTGLYTSVDDYKQIQSALVSAIPKTTISDHRASLKARIKYGNEISLRKRLQELVGPIDADIRKRIFGADAKFPSAWVDARNYYTHWDKTSVGNNLSDRDLYRANVRMRTLLRVLYLLRVGVPVTAIVKALDNASPESQAIGNLAAEEHRLANPGSQAGALFTIQRTDAPPLEVVPQVPEDTTKPPATGAEEKVS